jgi:hypothetical protein
MTADFRLSTASKWQAPRAVADGGGGTIMNLRDKEQSWQR